MLEMIDLIDIDAVGNAQPTFDEFYRYSPFPNITLPMFPPRLRYIFW
jgi:hypothetical protein